MTKRATRKRKWLLMRFRKKDVDHNLLAATSHWVKAYGGRAVVIGGIGILDEDGPLDTELSLNRYRVCVGVLGKKPSKREGQ